MRPTNMPKNPTIAERAAHGVLGGWVCGTVTLQGSYRYGDGAVTAGVTVNVTPDGVRRMLAEEAEGHPAHPVYKKPKRKMPGAHKCGHVGDGHGCGWRYCRRCDTVYECPERQKKAPKKNKRRNDRGQ